MATTRYLARYGVPCDSAFSLLEEVALDVADGRIAWVGEESAAPVHEGPTVKLNGLVMPGLINAHAHSPMTLLRGAGDGLPLMEWLTQVMWPREGQMNPEDALWGMRLGAAEMLLAGVTASCEMYLFEESLVQASLEAGIRLAITPGIISALHGETYNASKSRLSAIADFHSQYHNPESLITVGFGPHSAYDLSLDLCSEVAAAARDLDTLLHIHVCETRHEGANLEAAHDGRSTVELLASRGILDGKVLAAHSVWLSDSDMETFAQNNVGVAHCPVSNMKLGSGIASVVEMRRKGIDVGLATDGPASNDNLDLWEEIKLASLLARVSALDASSMSPKDALVMATNGGANALGNTDIGVLKPGAHADFIHIDLDDPTFVPVTNDDELIAHLAWAGSGRHVRDVWVGGRQVVADRQLTTVDVAETQFEVQQRGKRLAEQSGT